jgi:tetratricopeptide (TPR) repeat protein
VGSTEPAVRARARDLVERGYRLQLEGQLDRAKDCFLESITLEPTAEAHTFLGWALAQEGRVDDAIAECERALTLDPELGNAWSDIGAYLLEKGESEAAKHYFERALDATRFERHHYAHYNLGRVYLKQGLLMSALEAFRKAVSLEPRHRSARKAVRELLRRFN